MILSVDIQDKSFGPKQLMSDVVFTVQPKEKVGLIGRNGTGKSTLFGMITGTDLDFDGSIQLRRGAVVAFSRQEHQAHHATPAISYILHDLPQYAHLKHIIDTYPETMATNPKKLAQYADAVEHFSSLGYFEIEAKIVESLRAYQIDEPMAQAPLGQLSGGQKRFVELVKIQASKADIVLIDEPTNHMDYIAKKSFVGWLRETPEAVIAITHDRDVLREVDRIIEIRDGTAYSYPGNYDAYLRVNTVKIVSELNEYSVVQRRITNLRDDIVRFRRLKEKSRDPGTISRFKSLQQKAEKELEQLSTKDKPSFWIDKDSAGSLNDKISSSYDKHKAKNINVGVRRGGDNPSERLLVEVSKLSLGYDSPLFSDVTFRLNEGGRARLHGRNGAGKTTLVKALLATISGRKPDTKIFGGFIDAEKALKVGVYHQEVEGGEKLTLYQAIEQALRSAEADFSDKRVRSLMSNYLFDPIGDAETPVHLLSGGQKARVQLISMLAGDPVILVLDEPTNHLDLPSIEELEEALKSYHGAILYISHDTYFADKLGGQVVSIDKKA